MAKTQGHGRVLEALLASSESPVAAAQSLLDSAVAAGRAFDVVSSGGTLHMSTAFDQSSASGMNTEDGDGLAFLVSLLGLDGQGSKGEEGVSSASEPVDGEGAEASVTGIAGLEPSKATEERKHTKCDAVDEITSSGNVASNALSGVTVGCGFEQGGASGAMGSGKVFTRGMSMLANMGGGDCKGGSGRVGGADYGEKRSRGHEGVSSELGGAGVCSGGKGRTLDCLRSSRGTQDGGCAVQHRRRSVAQSIPGRQVYEKKGYLPFTSEEGRGDDAGLQGTSNHGSGAWGVGFLPSILLNDSALALQTALVALLQLQKQDEEGVKQEPVIPRRNLMCTAFLKTGVCNNPERCNYAHNMVELQKKLELRKTSLCKYWLKGKCENEDCNFAHGEHELQSTEGVYKTTICKYWKQGSCHSGGNCRHAHGEADLRPEKLPPHLERKRNHKVKHQWKSGSGCTSTAPSAGVPVGVGARGKQQPAHPVTGTRLPCPQDYSFDCKRAEQSFEKTCVVIQGTGRRGTDTSFGLDSCKDFSLGGYRNCTDDVLRKHYLSPEERTYEPSMIRTVGQTNGSDRLEGFPSSLGSVFGGGTPGVRPGQYELPCGRSAWGGLTVGGRASDEISDMSTASATSSRWGGADCRSSLPSFQEFTRENSGGSESLLRFSNSSITRVSSLAEEESCHGTTWRPGGVAPASGVSDVSPMAPSLTLVGHSPSSPCGGGGLIFVPPPGLSLHNDFGRLVVGRGSSHTATVPQQDETVLDGYQGGLSSGRYPYVSDAVLKTLSDSVAGLAVDENKVDRAKTANDDYLSNETERMSVPTLHLDRVAATEEVCGRVATCTPSSQNLGSSSRAYDDSRVQSKGNVSGTGVRIVSVSQV